MMTDSLDGLRMALAELAAIRDGQRRALERLEQAGADVAPLRAVIDAIDRKVARLERRIAAVPRLSGAARPRLTVVAGGRA